MRVTTQQLHLVPANHAAEEPRALAVQFSPSRLPQPTSGAAEEKVGRLPLVEPFWNQHGQLRLFVLFASGDCPAVNGEPAPPVLVLKPGDHLSWIPGHPGFRVALYNRPVVGPPPVSVLGKPCPVCRVPFEKTTTCVLCACGVAMHCELSGPDSLQCAMLRGTCPVCKRAVVLKEGYDATPHDND